MIIKLDKEFIPNDRMEDVRADMKEFKAAYTDGDLKIAFEDATGEYLGNEILKCRVEAFENCPEGEHETVFSVSMLTDGFVEIQRVYFFCDLRLKVNTDEMMYGGKMYSVKRYAQK